VFIAVLSELLICHYHQTAVLYVTEVDPPSARRQLCGGSRPAVERMLEFGRELYNMSLHLRQEQGKSENNKKMLQVHTFCCNAITINSFFTDLF
jgi:hypothetical protein